MTTMSGSDGASAGGSGERGWFSPPSDAAPVEREAPAERGAPAPRRIPASQAVPVPGPRPEPAPGAAADGPAAAPRRILATRTAEDSELIRATMTELEGSSDAATAYFYALLFVQYPQLREMFPAAMDSQRDRLFRALLTSVRLYDDPEVLVEYLRGLGRGHRKYGTLPTHYPAVGEALMAALSQYAPRSWGPRAEAAWVRAYTAISQIMIDAAAEDEARAPAWWDAEIVTHERRTPEIAVLTVRPDQPYPFRAGQYTSLETPWWPRVWRHYSFASAPRSDGLLTFHIKSVPAGWVSTSLVKRARPGDILRLGPPAGSMTVDHRADSGLLCLGGGTGIAPIKAMVEDVASQGRPRPVEVFYGARTDHDLYDLDPMLRLQERYDWLSVRPVVAAGRAPGEALAATAPGGGAQIRALAVLRRLPLGAARNDQKRGRNAGGARYPHPSDTARLPGRADAGQRLARVA